MLVQTHLQDFTMMILLIKIELNNFQLQNTYSYSLIKKRSKKLVILKFLSKKMNMMEIKLIKNLHLKKRLSGMTRSVNGVQIAGSKFLIQVDYY